MRKGETESSKPRGGRYVWGEAEGFSCENYGCLVKAKQGTPDERSVLRKCDDSQERRNF